MSSSLIVISGPSGCGKTTIAREILKRHPGIVFSVSATTRARRASEVHGKDYYFLTKKEFEGKIYNDELAEWEQIYGDYYGTPVSGVENAFRTGKSILLDVDVKGALSIKSRYSDDAVLIFIKPPSMEILIDRLKNRKTESERSIKKRIERVSMELEKTGEFDFSVVNDDLERAVAAVDDIVLHLLKEST